MYIYPFVINLFLSYHINVLLLQQSLVIFSLCPWRAWTLTNLELYTNWRHHIILWNVDLGILDAIKGSYKKEQDFLQHAPTIGALLMPMRMFHPSQQVKLGTITLVHWTLILWHGWLIGSQISLWFFPHLRIWVDFLTYFVRGCQFTITYA